jgi:hypothetical protein
MQSLQKLKNDRRMLRAELSEATRQKVGVSTSHIAHLVLSIITGVWFIVWAFSGIVSVKQRKTLDKKIFTLNAELSAVEENIEDETELLS